MGFFDLFSLMITGGIALSSVASDTAWDDEKRSKARKAGCTTYMDHRGVWRLICNEQPVHLQSDGYTYELCNKRNHMGLGIYRVDPGLKKAKEDKVLAERLRLADNGRKLIEKHFITRYDSDLAFIQRRYDPRFTDGRYLNYWFIPNPAYLKYKEQAGRSSWFLRTNKGYAHGHGYHIYDFKNQKFVMLIKSFNKEKAESMPPVKATLKYVLDDLEEGKGYLLDLSDEVEFLPVGIYVTDSIAVCKKGSQVELPPEHVLMQSFDERYHSKYGGAKCIASENVDVYTWGRELEPSDKEVVQKAYEDYKKNILDFGVNADYWDNDVLNVCS